MRPKRKAGQPANYPDKKGTETEKISIKRLFSFKQLFNFAPMIEGSPQEFTEKQKHLLIVAERLFATNGFDGTSVRDIAQEANVNLAMISYYFGSKEKLLQAVFEMRTRHIREQIIGMIEDQEMEPLEKIYTLIEQYVERIMNHQHFHKIMVREQIAQKDTTITGLIQSTKKMNQELIRKLIHEGQKKGAFRKNIDIPLMMMTLFGTANQMVSTQHHYRELNNLQHMEEEDFQKLLKKKLSIHLKTLFKAILTHE